MKVNVERSLLWTATGAFVLFAIGAVLTTIVPPLVSKDMQVSQYPLHEYTEQELRGIEIYKREGCVYCHTQQIRHLESDQKRYGWRLVDAAVSDSWEYVNDKDNFLGTKRTGPDLARVGGKYSSEWHWAHFKDPRNMGEKFPNRKGIYERASIMPSFAYLSDEEIKDLTAYIQTLGRNKNWRVDENGVPLNDYEK
ncbi:MAG: cbb3-type cytochrome c oxidase subunit II [Pontiellaceae bacterium]|nr:cbb3-type cytochrome c oxidase subunit II [Pontiellaceae bacterium]MBN2784950.1 cbb3-type cytochrome c oxidase subunit II [Pontiellaceae bacterium]